MATILVVDDDRRLVSGIARYLENEGYTTVTALDGREALEAIDRESVDLVLTDVNMPEMDGISLLVQSGERLRGVPVVAMSGGGIIAKSELLSDAAMLGATEVLEKPFSMQELTSIIERLLAEAAPGDE